MDTYIGGHSIPYALTFDEIVAFLDRNSGNAALQSYLSTGEPVYGIIVQEAYGSLLVWHDLSHPLGDVDGLHVIDVTNMSIATQVRKAPYESPDQSIIDNLLQQINKLLAAVKPTVNLGLIVGALVLVLMITREVQKA